jgi:tRNA 5-methylaminomethyl-2-thiouridine biosynthesis bifunctional protein
VNTAAAAHREALVIGAGLAGAAVCAQLARRGWHTTLLDAASGAARGASALPVGMLSPHVTRAPTPLSRLSALGMQATLAELHRLVPQGHGWQACEVDNLGHDPGRWPAALVRPGALVQAWLDESGEQVSFRSQAQVHRLVRTTEGHWRAQGTDGEVLAEAPVAVVTAAYGSLALLTDASELMEMDHLPLRPVKGQLSLAEQHGTPTAPRPQRESGVFVPRYEDSGLPPEWPARLWAMGSTYTRGDATTHLTTEAHEANALSLATISEPAAALMRRSLVRGDLLGWAQVRCASLDRLPLVGAVPDAVALRERVALPGGRRERLSPDDIPRASGLYMLGALGSRGITLAPLCASWLAAVIDGAPVQADPDLLAALDPARFAWRQARRRA